MGKYEVALQKVKDSLRITHNKLDEDIKDTISECLNDLEDSNIPANRNSPEENEDVMKALKLYCHYVYESDIGKSDKYWDRYNEFKSGLLMTGRYDTKEQQERWYGNE